MSLSAAEARILSTKVRKDKIQRQVNEFTERLNVSLKESVEAGEMNFCSRLVWYILKESADEIAKHFRARGFKVSLDPERERPWNAFFRGPIIRYNFITICW